MIIYMHTWQLFLVGLGEIEESIYWKEHYHGSVTMRMKRDRTDWEHANKKKKKKKKVEKLENDGKGLAGTKMRFGALN